MRWAFQAAKDLNEKEMNHHKTYYDRHMKCMTLCPDDIVLVRVKAYSNDRKITDKWEQNPYVVIEQIKEKPAFRVCPIDSKDSTKDDFLHQNMLYPL